MYIVICIGVLFVVLCPIGIWSYKCRLKNRNDILRDCYSTPSKHTYKKRINKNAYNKKESFKDSDMNNNHSFSSNEDMQRFIEWNHINSLR